jgi:hypothetical protein
MFLSRRSRLRLFLAKSSPSSATFNLLAEEIFLHFLAYLPQRPLVAMFELCCAMLLGVELRRDWAGREAVAPEGRESHPPGDSGSRGRAATELHRDYQRYLDDWQRQQHEAGERAFRTTSRRRLSTRQASRSRVAMHTSGDWRWIRALRYRPSKRTLGIDAILRVVLRLVRRYTDVFIRLIQSSSFCNFGMMA